MSDAKKTIISALVENKPGVLNRLVSLFRRRNFNIDSLTVGRTHKEHVSRMTIVLDSERINPRQMVANLYKLVNVIDARLISEDLHVERDLALIKVRTDDSDSYNTVAELCERFPARIIDMGHEVAIIEITARTALVEEFIAALKPIGIHELVRTGVVAMGRGKRTQDTNYEPATVHLNGLDETELERSSV
jgi:acetolactate synthase-1/3 small subunit